MDFIDQFFRSYIGAIIILLVGGLIIRYAKKDDARGNSQYAGGKNLKLWRAGILMILAGATLLIAKLIGKV